MPAKETVYAVAGTSITAEGLKTFRFSNGPIKQRAYMLRHGGHTNIKLFELPKPMDQLHAIAWVLTNVPGSKNAVIATRAAEKYVKSELIIAAEELAKRSKDKVVAQPKKATKPAQVATRGRGRPARTQDADEPLAA
jgi:hypothetical protein